MPRWLKFGLLMLAILLFASLPLAMQFDVGAIEGVITNDRGPVADANVEARNINSGVVMRTESDNQGFYRLENMRAGRYSLWIEAPGNASLWIPRVAVERGQTTIEDIRLNGANIDASR